MTAKQCAIVYGNPIDGLGAIGPFANSEAANEYVDALKQDYWWIAEIESPGAEYLDAAGGVLLASGSPFDGITLTGPFASTDASIDYAEEEGIETWWSVDMETVVERDASPTPF